MLVSSMEHLNHSRTLPGRLSGPLHGHCARRAAAAARPDLGGEAAVAPGACTAHLRLRLRPLPRTSHLRRGNGPAPTLGHRSPRLVRAISELPALVSPRHGSRIAQSRAVNIPVPFSAVLGQEYTQSCTNVGSDERELRHTYIFELTRAFCR